ncbi:MAG: M23 family metallopeptidase [Bacteroidales bacterium]|nr:M23 family metallopeptidase [Bacteroidales bacterium]
MHLTRIALSILLLFINLEDNPKEKSVFISPLTIPLSLSSNFGELRTDHFHSGIDLRTQGVTGKEIVAAASGYVYRISVSPGGFGKALYMKHPSGYSTVYGHLDRFIPGIEEYVKKRQYEQKSFTINIYPPSDKFEFKQGEVIAYSGNTGSSSGPHLHYEIRKSDTEAPVNPLIFDFGVEDNIKPIIERLVIYPVGRNSMINGDYKPLRLNVSGGHGNYYVPSEKEILISGKAGFGIKSFDLMNESYSRFSAYSISLKVDSNVVYRKIMDSFMFDETRYINSHIDYETLMRERTYIEKLFRQPNNKLSLYKDIKNDGIVNITENRKYHISIEVTDIKGNKSELSFYVRFSVPWKKETFDPEIKNSITMPYGRNNRFAAKNISVTIPAGSLYDTLYFEYKKTQGINGMLSEIHQVHNKYVPVHKAYSLAIKPDIIPAGKESKMLIAEITEDWKRIPLTSRWEDGFLVANPLRFGSFFVGIDTVPPAINPEETISGADLSDKKLLKIRIFDNFSGIKSYESYIDGNWALFEWDQKNNLIIHALDSDRMEKGKNHSFTLKVKDNCENVSIYKCDFFW